MIAAMRNAIWDWLRSGVPEGSMLPWRALVARAVLYPLDTFYWRMSRTRGYQLETDTWLIEGVRYSGVALRRLADEQERLYRISKVGDVVVLHCPDEGPPF